MQKGFTLIELLIVIAIVAILAAAVVVVLNPGQLLAQARDGQRIADLDSLRNAVSLMLATATTTTGYFNASTTCMVDNDGGSTATATAPFATTTCAVNASTAIDGTGWVTANFHAVSGGSPLAALPSDPTNDATYHYAWTSNVSNLTFEVNTRLESQKHRTKMTSDGGNKNTCPTTFTEVNCFYEVGNDPGLDL